MKLSCLFMTCNFVTSIMDVEYFHQSVVMLLSKFVYMHDSFLKITCLLFIFGPQLLCKIFSILTLESNGISHVRIWKKSFLSLWCIGVLGPILGKRVVVLVWYPFYLESPRFSWIVRELLRFGKNVNNFPIFR